jgi:Clp amino terminal domain, pathogenicity island component
MTPLNVNLQRLIEAVDADLPGGDALAKVGEAQQRARSLSDIGDQLIDHFVAQARAAGTTWSQIGDTLGVSKQAAQQRWVPPVYQNFTDRARHAIVLAQERARGLRHGYIGTEHLLLGLLDEAEGVASLVLAELIGSADAVRAATLAAAPAGSDNPPQKIPFTANLNAALGQANAQSADLGHNYVGTEHLLLGLLMVPGSLGAGVLRELGASYDEVRAKVAEWIASYLAHHPDAVRRVQAARDRAAAQGDELS